MNDTVNTPTFNKEELAKIMGLPVEAITDVKVTEGKDTETLTVEAAKETPAQ